MRAQEVARIVVVSSQDQIDHIEKFLMHQFKDIVASSSSATLQNFIRPDFTK